MVNVHCIETLTISNWILKRSGLWPTKILSKSTAMKITFNIFVDCAVLGILVHNIVIAINSGNIKLLNWMTCIIIPITSYIAKSTSMLLNKKCFFKIIDDLNSEAFNVHSGYLNRHIRLIQKISMFVVRYFVIAQTVFAIIFNILPFVMNIQMMIPPSFDTGKFDILYKIAHLFCAIYLGVNSTALDILCIVLMALCAAQLNILEERLTNLLHDAKKLYKNTSDIVDKILRECVILHETINGFVTKLDIVLSLPLFVQYASGCFMICNTILQLTIMSERDSTNLVGLCGYSAIVFAQMSVYHFLGNEILFKSDKIIESCYLSDWYELDIKYQKMIILLMERAKRPLAVTLYKLVIVSLASLSVVIRWSYSIFALIRASYN